MNHWFGSKMFERHYGIIPQTPWSYDTTISLVTELALQNPLDKIQTALTGKKVRDSCKTGQERAIDEVSSASTNKYSMVPPPQVQI